MITTLLGKKLGMTQVFTNEGLAVPVTVIEAGPCTVLQVKTKETDGYTALQVGFAPRRKKSTPKPQLGVFKKAGTDPKHFVRELPWDGKDEFKIGQAITTDVFEKIEWVDVIGTSKGKGFQGTVKRWNFRGGPATHGQSDRERAPGSLGRQHSISEGVPPGKKMSGHLGHERITIRNLKLERIVKDPGGRNLLLVRGAVPGATGDYVIVQKAKTKREAAHHLQPESERKEKKGKKS